MVVCPRATPRPASATSTDDGIGLVENVRGREAETAMGERRGEGVSGVERRPEGVGAEDRRVKFSVGVRVIEPSRAVLEGRWVGRVRS